LLRFYKAEFWLRTTQGKFAQKKLEVIPYFSPLFLPEEAEDGTRWVKYQVIGNGDVAVPTHFFKVIYLESSGESLAYILPNGVSFNKRHESSIGF